MKTPLCLLSFLFFGLIISQAQQIDSVHQKKAEWIMERLHSNQPLPEQIICITCRENLPLPFHIYEFKYSTKRMVNGKLVNKVLMEISVDDSLTVLDFDENYSLISDTLKGYHYNIEKGEMTWAYNYKSRPDSLQSMQFYRSDGKIEYPDNLKHDHLLMIDKKMLFGQVKKTDLGKLRERDRKSFAFYEPKLLKSIDELYDLLNK